MDLLRRQLSEDILEARFLTMQLGEYPLVLDGESEEVGADILGATDAERKDGRSVLGSLFQHANPVNATERLFHASPVSGNTEEQPLVALELRLEALR